MLTATAEELTSLGPHLVATVDRHLGYRRDDETPHTRLLPAPDWEGLIVA
jgi:hypothetical protein